MGILIGLSNKIKIDRLSRPLDEVLFTIGLLKKLGRANISTLDNRIICQKIVFFASHLGIAPDYRFNLYLRGPYSPGLATDLYSLYHVFANVTEVDFLEDRNKEKFSRLCWLCEELGYNPRKMEVAATFYAFYERYKSVSIANRETERIKTASSDEVKAAVKALTNAGLVG